MRKSLFILPLFLAACNGAAPEPASVDVDELPTFTLRATGDISLPEPMTMATYVPNNVAEWAGHILLLSESGDVWRTSSEGEPPEKITSGPFSDIFGLSRDNKAGVFLTLGKEGKLSAFIEADDEGNFNPLAVSYGGPDITAFCEGPGFSSSWLIGADDAVHAFSVAVKDEMIAEVTIEGISALKSGAKSCHAPSHERYYYQDKTLQYVGAGNMTHWAGAKDVSPLGDNAQIGFDPKTGTPLLSVGANLFSLEIEDGLSIRGLEAASFVSTTSYAMGSVFNDGIILMGEKDENRMVIISAQYAKTQISK